jgi:ferredoxin
MKIGAECPENILGGVRSARKQMRFQFLLALTLGEALPTINEAPRIRYFCGIYDLFERRNRRMTHVVTQPCFGCKYTDCVVVCPVECFYEGEKMLYIHPEECIDCEACVPECPVEAIYHEDNVPEEWKEYTEMNAEMAEKTEVITEKKEPLADN